MTTFVQDFASAINVAGVITALGTVNSISGGERIYPVKAKEKTEKPYIVWRRNGGDPLATLSGASLNRVRADVLVGCYADKFDTAAAIADAVYVALASASTRLRIVPRPAADAFDPDTRLFLSVVEVSVFHRPSA